MATKKAAVKKTAASSTVDPVSVRMYRQGLGDCFLITFPRSGAKPFRMLIDCGVVLGTADASAQMQRVVADLKKATDNHIDLLVVTHEHWDHVSGFNQAQDLFKDLSVQQVWVAWTEDPKDALATKLRAERRATENALRMALNHLALAGDSGATERVGSLVAFFGATAGSTSDALAFAKGLAPSGKLAFRTPGEPPITLPDLPGVRFYVMGPPKDEKLIRKSNPGVGEAYTDSGGDGKAMLMSGLLGATFTVGAEDSIEDPFDEGYKIPFERAKQVEFFQQRYFGNSTDESLMETKLGTAVADQSWRRIDSSWIGPSETMALQLDSATNNTSLVLAIELMESKQILLFPGDAQAGNWLSWQDLKFDVDGKTVTGPDLLARTTFYKVGHHGSHNATLKEKGLELMVNDALVAMIPVDHEMALKKRWGRMPLPDLVDRLKVKTHGRVLKVDDAVKSPADLGTLKPDKVDPAEWKKFTDRVQVTELYYEISF